MPAPLGEIARNPRQQPGAFFTPQPLQPAGQPPEGVAQLGNLFVVTNECKFAADRGRGTIVIQSANTDFPRAIDELSAQPSRELAIAYAGMCGMANARINGQNIGPYAINEDAKLIETLTDDNGAPLPPRHPKMQPVAYRVEVPVTRPLM